MILNLTVTAAGYAALVNAESTGTDAVTVTEIGLTESPFVAADTLTALPAELKRVDTIAGIATGANTLNLVMRDDGDDVYSVSGFGLYLDDGTLFAVCSAAEVIVEKAGLASVLVTIDVAFTNVDAGMIEFGDMTWTNPAATEAIMGVVELATMAEAALGTDASRVITAKILHDLVRLLTITGTGLVTGGGNLTANRVLNVSEASEAETLAGIVGDKVVTPRRLQVAIAALIAGAPGALNTLDELAAALGDDANFAATVANQLSLKATIAYVDAMRAADLEAMKVERCGTLVAIGYLDWDETAIVPCDGRAISRAGNARLFAKIGTTYGVGDGATTFNVPEIRGEFIRALDMGRGIDPGRTLGSWRAQSLESHAHAIPAQDNGDGGNGFVEDANGTGTARSTFTAPFGDTETRPRSVAFPIGIWR